MFSLQTTTAEALWLLKPSSSLFGFQSVNIYIKKDARKGVVNNTQTDWSFRLDGVLHSTSQELAYETVAQKLVSEALSGYNGNLSLF